MKKLFLFALMTIMSIGAFSQVNKGLRYGVQGFGGLSSITGSEAYKSTFGVGAGAVMEYNFSEKLFLGSGLNFQMKGASVGDGTMKLFYLTLPIHVGSRIAFWDSKYFHFSAGPQLGYGIAGSQVGESKFSNYGNSFEVAVGAKLGVEFNRLQVNVLGNYGVTGPLKGVDSLHNLDISLGVAYMF